VSVDTPKRVAEVVGQGFVAVMVRGAGAEGYCRTSMGDDWRVCIAFGDLPHHLESRRQALISALGCLGDQIAVSSSGTQIFLYALQGQGYKRKYCLFWQESRLPVKSLCSAARDPAKS
jgi:hypothetical protein